MGRCEVCGQETSDIVIDEPGWYIRGYASDEDIERLLPAYIAAINSQASAYQQAIGWDFYNSLKGNSFSWSVLGHHDSSDHHLLTLTRKATEEETKHFEEKFGKHIVR